MTFGSLWSSGESSASAVSYVKGRPDRFPPSSFFAAERGDSGGYSYGGGGGGGGYAGGSYGAGPTKSKKGGDKKQAAMSALTLIAFLFFLNILQNCLHDHTEEEEEPVAAIMMVQPNQILQGRDPSDAEEHQMMEKVDTLEVKSRKLLSIDESEPHNHERESKFIHNFNIGKRDWTNELTQVTDEDLVGQKQKVDQLRQLWNKNNVNHASGDPNRRRKPNLEEEVKLVKVKKFVNNPVLSDIRGIPKLSQYWEAQKTSTQPPETKYVDFEEPSKKVADFHEFESFNSGPADLTDLENNIVENAATSLHLRADPTHADDGQHFAKSTALYPAKVTDEQEVQQSLETSAAPLTALKPRPPVGQVEPVIDPYAPFDALNTPRYRRSEEQLTTLPTEELFYPEKSQLTPNPVTEPTTKTYHVYTHPSQMFSSMWKTTAPPPSATTTTTTLPPPTTKKFDIANIYLTTVRPMPGRVHPSKRYPGYPANHRPHYGPATRHDERYKFSPYRRVSYEPPLVRQEYYPMSVVGQYGGSEGGPSLGILQLLWSLVSSFAKPIARLVPNASKVGGEAQCFDLMACEAHRMATYMGPTAQALATTFSSLLKWVTPETEKSALEEAVAAARDNTCAQQIRTCDDRSGGKSAMTMVAKLMELRPDREARLPRS